MKDYSKEKKNYIQLSLNFEKQRGPKRLAFVVRCVVSFFFKILNSHGRVATMISDLSLLGFSLQKFIQENLNIKWKKKRTQC